MNDGPDIRKINVNGQQIEAELVGFIPPNEPWLEIVLNSGTLIKVKNVVVRVMRIKDAYDEYGEPSYFVQTKAVMMATAPMSLRRPEE